MVGWIAPRPGRGSLQLIETQVRGIPLLRAEVPLGRWPHRAEKHLRRAARRLRACGVRRVLASEPFSGWPLLKEEGLCPVDPLPFCRALAPRLVLALLERQGTSPGQAAVLLRGSRVDRVLYETAHALCPAVRTLAVDAPEGGEDLCRQLGLEYGAAVAETLGERPPHAAVEFARRALPLPGALRLYGPKPGLGGLTLRGGEDLPDGVDQLPLLALLWEERRLWPTEPALFPGAQSERNLTEGEKIPIITY